MGSRCVGSGGFDSSVVIAFIGMVGDTAAAQAWSWIRVVVYIKYLNFWVWCIQWDWRLMWGTLGIFFLMQGINVQWVPFRFEGSLTCGHNGCIFHTHLFFYSSNVLWSVSSAFLLKCCLYRSHLLNLSIVLFLGKAGVHCSFFVFWEKKYSFLRCFLWCADVENSYAI